jgi:hypothetical protein
MTALSTFEMPISLRFEYGNPFSQKEANIPVFLRCQGVNGSLSLDYPEDSVDKIKIVLQGECFNKDICLNLINNGNRNTHKHTKAPRWLFIPFPATQNCDQSSSMKRRCKNNGLG